MFYVCYLWFTVNYMFFVLMLRVKQQSFEWGYAGDAYFPDG